MMDLDFLKSFAIFAINAYMVITDMARAIIKR